jgi:hypothetical protein
MKIGFILNHYDLHQVPHIVPYAFELSRDYDDCEVVIFSSSQAEEEFARKIGHGYPGHKCTFKLLHVPSLISAIDPLLSKLVFARKKAVLKDNLEALSQFEVLVVPEMTSLVLQKLSEMKNVKLVFTGHGAGDNREFGSFNERIGKFDLCLMPGRKYADGLREAGHLPDNRYAIAGYPKFEAVKHLASSKRKLFENDKPVVVYNPHHLPNYTSWAIMGEKILDFFYENDDFNLVFCPHVLLFRRSWTKGAKFPRKYKNTPNVIIDIGSRNSVDMTYLRSADIYIGDVSSQIYEFLEEPRPCIFLNAHQVDWEDDISYLQWRFGQLIENADDLGQALNRALETHPQYVDFQKSCFQHTFAVSERTAGSRGAEIIVEFARTGKVAPDWL